MKQPTLKIYIDRLRDDSTFEFSETYDPSFLEISDNEVKFEEPITVSGEAYLAKDWLIVSFSAETHARLVCAVCNAPFTFEVVLSQVLHEEPVEEIRDKSFDLLPIIRETILLELPFYPQCGMTVCNNRAEIDQYLKKESSKAVTENPFKDML